MRRHNYINEKEIDKLVKYVDAENKGYVSFREFHQKIKANMTNFDEKVRKFPKFFIYLFL